MTINLNSTLYKSLTMSICKTGFSYHDNLWNNTKFVMVIVAKTKICLRLSRPSIWKIYRLASLLMLDFNNPILGFWMEQPHFLSSIHEWVQHVSTVCGEMHHGSEIFVDKYLSVITKIMFCRFEVFIYFLLVRSIFEFFWFIN